MGDVVGVRLLAAVLRFASACKHLVVFMFALVAFNCSFAEQWFDAGISEYDSWPENGEDKVVIGQGTWRGTEYAFLNGGRLQVDASFKEGQLSFGPAVQKNPQTAPLEYTTTIRVNPFDELPKPEACGDAHCGWAVFKDEYGSTNYCGIVKNQSGEGSIWVKLDGVTPDCATDMVVTVSVKMEGGLSYVRYAAKGVALTYNAAEWLEIVSASNMEGSVSFVGLGSLASLSAVVDSVDPAVMNTLTIPDLEHYSVESVKIAGKEVLPDGEGRYIVEQGSVVTVAFDPAPGWAIDVASMTFVVNDDMTLPEIGRPDPVNVAAAITINEVMAKNGSTLRTATGFEGLDWVELYNSGDEDVDLGGWYMGNDPTKNPSKWKPIQGSCVVPAKGYKIVWFDGDGLCTSWRDDEAHVAANISTDAGKHTVFLAAVASTDAIVQQIKMPGGVKDVSYGRGHLTRTFINSTSGAEYKVGDGAWKNVHGPLGMSAAVGDFTIVSYKINQSVGNMDAVDAFLLDPSTWTAGYPVTNTSPLLAFAKSGSTCSFATELYQNFPGASGDHMIYVATGTIMIPEGGDWTFDVGSDDGFSAKLKRLDKSWGWECRGTRGYAHSSATFNLEAGSYEVEVVYFNATGGYSLDFSAAKGRVSSFSAETFSLVGMGDVVHAGALGSQVAADVSNEMVGVSKTLDWRTSFMLDDAPHSNDVFRLLVKYADGFSARLNGKSVASVEAAGARSAASALQAQTFLIAASDVVKGTNTLEITAENDDIDDTEFYLSVGLLCDKAEDMMVYFTSPTPGAANGGNGRTGFTPAVVFSEAHGWKDSAFDLELSCPGNEFAVIYYTLDGSSPTIGDPATFQYVGPIHVDSTTVVRAAVPDIDSILQVDSSATYLFYDDVIAQDASVPAGFPTNAAVNSQKMLYGLATAVTQGDEDTQARLRRGFTENTRTVSLVIDPKNLFDPASGIYVNATGNGRGWERQTMVEQINPMDSSDEFSVPAGIRIRGAFSRGAAYPKHSFRLFFRSEYGMGTLKHPLFGDEGASEFEKIDFRTSQNHAWANDSSNDTFIHECFSRDSERDMGKTYNRSRYYHLFINGIYWGLYQTEERVDNNYAESYNGGVADNYDVVRTSQPGYNTGVVEGETEAWTELWRITTEEGYGEGHEANYYKVRGLNPDGTRNPDYPVLLNVTNLIEYILTSHFTEDHDTPANTSGMANNIIAFRNRNDGEGKEDGFLWNRHDAEHSLGLGGNYTAFGTLIYGTPENVTTRDVMTLGNFNPNLLNYMLLTNAEYRAVFADLVYKHMVKPGGALTVPVAEARYRARMAEIDDAVVCESARWGFQYSSERTRETWLTSCNNRITFIQNRLPYLLAEYKRRGWYPSVDAPVALNGLGVELPDGTTVASDDMLYLTGGASGTVYYTLDGSDPRGADDAVAEGAIEYSGASPVPVYLPVISKGGEWKYSDAGEKPADDWASAKYDDSSWKVGAGRLGFANSGSFATSLYRYVGGGSSGTQVTTYYFRRKFTMPAGASEFTELKAALDCDDGYIAYINGVEVKRDQVNSTEYDAFATATNMGEKETTFTFAAGTLVEGENVIAVEVHQCNATSSDAWWDLALSYPVAGEVEGGIVVPPEGLSIKARVKSASGEWSALATVSVRGEMPPATASEGLRLAEAMTSAQTDDTEDYLVVTNIAAGEIQLEGVRIVAWNAKKKSEADPSLTYVFGSGMSLMPGASLKVVASSFPTDHKLTNSKVGLRIYDADTNLVQDVILDADWWGGACDGTGEHFLAKTFGLESITHTNWMPTATSLTSKLRVLEMYTSTIGDGDTGEFVVLTNLDADAKLDLTDVRIVAWNAKKKSEADPSLTIALADVSIQAGATLRLDKETYFGGGKFTNGQVGLKIYDPANACVQEVGVDADWWDKACDGTGESFIAIEFGALVNGVAQWSRHLADWPGDPDTQIKETTAPADLNITSGAFTNSTPAELRKLAKWAKARGVSFAGASVQEMSFDAKGNPLTLPAAAYLLGCEPTEEKVAEGRASFRFTEIVPGTTPSIDATGYNGTITTYGADDPGGPWTVEIDSLGTTKRFYRATLTR